MEKSYRYTLVSDFRQDLREIRVNIIKAYTTDKRLPAGKLYYYGKAKGTLANAECDMEHMVGNPVNIMSYSQWADFAEIMDKVPWTMTLDFECKNYSKVNIKKNISQK